MTKVAVIGLGRWGQNIVRTLATLSDCEISAVCDPAENIAEKLTTLIPNHNILTFNDQKELLATKEYDAVIIATPGSTHKDIALPFIEQGVPVFIEKPFTTNSEDAEILATAAKKSGSIIGVGHIHLYNPAYQALKKELPRIGNIQTVICEGGNNGPIRNDMSALWDWAPHDLAVMYDLGYTAPTVIHATATEILNPGKNLQDGYWAHLQLNETTNLIMSASWLLPEKRKKIIFLGEKGSLLFNDTTEEKITLLTYPTAKNPTPTPEYIHYKKTSPLTLELEAFLHAIKTNQAPPSNLTQAVVVTKIIAAIEEKF